MPTENDTIKTMMARDGLTYTEAVARLHGEDEPACDLTAATVDGKTFTRPELDALTALRDRLTEFAGALVKCKFAYLLRALALAKQNAEAKDQKAVLTIKIELSRDGDAYDWEGTARESYPAAGKAESKSGSFDPNQPELPGTGEA